MKQSVPLGILRIASALIFLPAGTSKLINWPMAAPMNPAPGSQIYIGAWIEAVGGLLLLLGLCTRPVAFLLSGTMAVAYWQYHALEALKDKPGQPALPIHSVIVPSMNGGVAAAIFCFVFLYLTMTGGGAMSLDAKLGAKKSG
ncbi:MAG: DoxX family protein [Chthonomonas sp.]|nr:DoxX family protein [Chthonomonas sp.]